MLEDSSFAHVVSWNSSGDAFVVKVSDFIDMLYPYLTLTSTGHERVHKIDPATHVQAL